MSCREFDRYTAEELEEASLRAHADSCARCRRRLLLVDTLRALPPVDPPPGLDERIRLAARRARPGAPVPLFLRVAAAVLLLAGAATALLIPSDPEVEYRPRQLQVVEGGRNGTTDEQLVIEELYGPEVPILMAGGGGRNAGRRR